MEELKNQALVDLNRLTDIEEKYQQSIDFIDGDDEEEIEEKIDYDKLVSEIRQSVIKALETLVSDKKTSLHNATKLFEQSISCGRQNRKIIKDEIDEATSALNEINNLLDLIERYRQK